MGVSRVYIIFENGIPDFPTIRDKFKEQTGLPLNLVVDIDTTVLTHDTTYITKAIAENNGLNSDDSNSQKNTISLSNIRLETYGFLSIDFMVKENIIWIQIDSNDGYVITSFRKVLFDLGGKVCDSEGNIYTDWKIPDSWKKLKKWADYSLFNRPKR